MNDTPAAAPMSGRDDDPDPGSPIRRMSLRPPRRSTRHSGRRRRKWVVAAAMAAVLAGAGGGMAVWASQLGPEEHSAEGDAVPGSFAGTWSGQMSQEDADGSHVLNWDTRVKLEAGVERGSSEWYTLDCRGSLTLTERDGDRLVFDYVETYDPEKRCVDEAELVLRRSGAGEELEAQWRATSHSGTPMTSTGILR